MTCSIQFSTIKHINTDIQERIFGIYSVDEYYACCTFIISLCDSFEPLLTGSIPDLHLQPPIADLYDLGTEVYADGGNMIVSKLAILAFPGAKAGDDVGLADSSITHDDNLDHVVIDIAFFCSFDALL